MPVKGTFREINFSPSTTNVLDCVGRTDLYTVNRRPVWICLNWKGDFRIIVDSRVAYEGPDNLQASYALSQAQVGIFERVAQMRLFEDEK